jgi:RimJ/RimL family protein N-acetyltransferase
MDRPAVAPRLETERLILRAHVAADLEACLAFWCDPGVYEYIAGKPSSREEIWRGILRHIGQWQVVGFGFWLIEDRASQAFVGEVGFLDCKRDLTPSMDETPEVGWALYPTWQNQGLALEAMRTVMLWGDQHLEQTTTACIISPKNKRSLGLAGKLGFKPVTDVVYRGETEVLHHRQKALA